MVLVHLSDEDCTNRAQNTEIKNLRTAMKTLFLSLSREGISVRSELNLEMLVLMWGTAKTTALHQYWDQYHSPVWALQGSATADPAIPPLQTEGTALMAAPRQLWGYVLRFDGP